MKYKLRIRELRKERGMTQRQLATVLGVGHANICKWELGISDPLMERLPAIANALGVSVPELFAASSDHSSA